MKQIEKMFTINVAKFRSIFFEIRQRDNNLFRVYSKINWTQVQFVNTPQSGE